MWLANLIQSTQVKTNWLHLNAVSLPSKHNPFQVSLPNSGSGPEKQLGSAGRYYQVKLIFCGFAGEMRPLVCRFPAAPEPAVYILIDRTPVSSLPSFPNGTW